MALPEPPSRLKTLSEERQTYVVNWLMRGGEVMSLTRTMQQEWKFCTDVNERTLCMQMNRYKKQLTASATEPNEITTADGVVSVKAARNRNIDPMERLVALVQIQEGRLQMFLKKEHQVQMPIAGVDKVIDSTKQLLLDIQKIRFELGLDEFHAATSNAVLLKGATKTFTTLPNGATQTTTQLYEAVALADQILNRAAVPANLKFLGRDVDAEDRG